MSEWYFREMGQAFGPFSASQLREKAAMGRIASDTPVRKGTDGKWVEASRVKGLIARQPKADTLVEGDRRVKPLRTTGACRV